MANIGRSQKELKRSRVMRCGVTARELMDEDYPVNVEIAKDLCYDEDDKEEHGICFSSHIASKGGGRTQVYFLISSVSFAMVIEAMMQTDQAATEAAIGSVSKAYVQSE